ncbi:DNA-protecting protein DprA [Candidatus Micrarchaeota archaeon]|nr:DNA-protecting protein DprA [Candidatus Micrarchaeota archaeon]
MTSQKIVKWRENIRYVQRGEFDSRFESRLIGTQYVGESDAFMGPKSPVIITGTTKASIYELKIAADIAKNEFKKSKNIITTGSHGVEEYVMKMVAHFQGQQAVFIVSPLRSPTPSENIWLFEMILKHKGAIISTPNCELPDESIMLRNQIMVYLSDNLVIVSAKPNSGSINILEESLKQKKPVYVVDYPPNDFLFARYPVEEYKF